MNKPKKDEPIDYDVDPQKFNQLADEMDELWIKTLEPIWDKMVEGFDWSAETNP